jgi:hypothetical protein
MDDQKKIIIRWDSKTDCWTNSAIAGVQNNGAIVGIQNNGAFVGVQNFEPLRRNATQRNPPQRNAPRPKTVKNGFIILNPNK